MPCHGKCHTFVFAQFEIALGILIIFNEIFDQLLFVALCQQGRQTIHNQCIPTKVIDIKSQPLQFLQQLQNHWDLGGWQLNGSRKEQMLTLAGMGLQLL